MTYTVPTTARSSWNSNVTSGDDMKYINKIIKYFNSTKTTRILANVILFISFLLLLTVLGDSYNDVANKLLSIIKPFVISFVIAFALNKLVAYLGRYLPRGLAVFVVYLGILALFIGLIFLVIPMMFSNAASMVPQITRGLSEIEQWITLNTNYDIQPLISQAIEQITAFFKNFSFMNGALDFISNVINNTLNFVVYFILAIYMSYSYPAIRLKIKKAVSAVDVNLVGYFRDIEEALHSYFKAFAIGACIQAVEFFIVYLIIGNENWLVLGILGGLGSIIPYVGAMSANLIGVLATFYLGFDRVVFLLILIAIQSNIDSYVIGPRIYSATTGLTFISILFGIFAGSAFFGVIGMLIMIPILIIFKTCRNRYLEQNKKVEV